MNIEYIVLVYGLPMYVLSLLDLLLFKIIFSF